MDWITCGKPGVVVCRVKNDMDGDGNHITRFFCDEIAAALRGKKDWGAQFKASNGWLVGSLAAPGISQMCSEVWLCGISGTADIKEVSAPGHHAEMIAEAINEAAADWEKEVRVARFKEEWANVQHGWKLEKLEPAIDWERRRWDLASVIFRDAMNKPLGEVDDAMGAVRIAATGSLRCADALIAAFQASPLPIPHSPFPDG